MVYEFVCADCGEVLELRRPITSDAPWPTECPGCGGMLRRRWTPPLFYVRGRAIMNYYENFDSKEP